MGVQLLLDWFEQKQRPGYIRPQRIETIAGFVESGTVGVVLPVLINDKWPLLATWTRQANSPTFGYIGQLWKFLQQHKEFLRHPASMLVGDLNSNSRWDKWDRWWNHSDVVSDLASIGLRSAYHEHYREEQGVELRPTFYLQRNINKPYHIDYGFYGPAWVISEVEVGLTGNWLPHSDHMPILMSFAPKNVEHLTSTLVVR